ncbi:lactam utilization protein LamB [Paenibacillus sp. PK3_47]|uniref:LamB/YcsF family protein n=1 Tax=Paenibacillus sp. PK3_47 TaxID=2072642 RepID=UPI00201E2979|nr:5-oxoprolinase subunit PxpA [Paenibacillus sp. PK3_47]UQZ33238.1 lactam utilization protein LamB [Paenibacillus sp. PK3_47]
MQQEIDINCDLGESFGVYRYGADHELFPLASSVNVACGFHAGDPRIMRETIEAAAAFHVKIGAHVGFPDRLGFGRRMMDISPEDAYDYCLYQMGALEAFLKAARLPMSHLKLHGAFYMMAAVRSDVAGAVVQAVLRFNPQLAVYTLPDSELAVQAAGAGLTVVNEIFADRPYDADGVKMFGWTLQEVGGLQEIGSRVLRQLQDNRNAGPSGRVGTICVHSDTPDSPAIVRHVRSVLEQAGWTIGKAAAAAAATDLRP